MGLSAPRATGSHAAAAMSAPRRRAVAATRAVGMYFAGSAALNAVHTVRIAPRLLTWLRDSAWLPPCRRLLGVVEAGREGLEVPLRIRHVRTRDVGRIAERDLERRLDAGVLQQLLRGRRVSGSLRWAQAWVLGLVPALPWPYWVPNAVSAVVFEVVRRATRTAGPMGQ